MKTFLINDDLRKLLIEYLSLKPYIQVSGYLSALDNLEPIQITNRDIDKQ